MMVSVGCMYLILFIKAALGYVDAVTVTLVFLQILFFYLH